MNAWKSLILSVGLALPQVAQAEPTSSDAQLVIDTSGMRAEYQDTAGWLMDDGTEVLRDLGIEVHPDAKWEVRVEVWEEETGFATQVTVGLPGAEPSLIRDVRRCDGCPREEVIDLVQRELAWTGGWLARETARIEEPVTDPEPEPEPTAPKPEPKPSPEPQRVDRAPRFLRPAGMTLVIAGGGVLVGGVALLGTEAGRVPTPGYTFSTDLRPAGILLTTVGAVSVTTGTALLVLHILRQKKARRTALVPLPGGVAFSSRF